ncbi:MAG: hypothetical protein U0470_03190 [Anaerolineae bacterium]
MLNTLRAERGLAPLPRVGALDLVAAQQADRLALDGGLATPEADAASLRSAVTAAGWAAPPDLGVARAYAVRRTLDQAADWFVRADNPDGPSLFDDRATAAGAGAARLRDGRTAWVLVVAAGAQAADRRRLLVIRRLVRVGDPRVVRGGDPRRVRRHRVAPRRRRGVRAGAARRGRRARRRRDRRVDADAAEHRPHRRRARDRPVRGAGARLRGPDRG